MLLLVACPNICIAKRELPASLSPTFVHERAKIETTALHVEAHSKYCWITYLTYVACEKFQFILVVQRHLCEIEDRNLRPIIAARRFRNYPLNHHTPVATDR